MMKAITEFMKMLRGLHGSSAASIVYRSELKHNKTLRGSVDKGITWSSVFGDKEVTVARELTKKFEEVLRANPKIIQEKLSASKPRGEFVIVI